MGDRSGNSDIWIINASGNIITPTPTATPTPGDVISEDDVIATINVGEGPWEVVANPITNRIYVANFNGSSVSVIDGSSNQVIDTINASFPQAVDVNHTTNQIYVSKGFDIEVIDGSSNQIVNTIIVGGASFPINISVNPNTNRIYATNNSDINVIDGATNLVIDTITFTPFSTADEFAVNPVTNRIYATSNSFDSLSGISNGVVNVVDSFNNQIIDTILIPGISAREVAINSITNRIYVAGSDADFNGIVTVIDGLTNEIINSISIASTFIGRIAVNQSTNVIYAVNDNNNSVTIIDGVTGQVINIVKTGNLPIGIGINSTTNLVYVTNHGSNDVTVIGASPEPTTTPSGEATPTPDVTPTPPIDGKSFTFNCEHEFVNARNNLEKLILRENDNEQCMLKLTELEPGTLVKIATNIRGIRSTVEVNPSSGVTNANGEIEFTINAIDKGIAWIAWAVQGANGEFNFNKNAYDSGDAWGMFVEVK